MSHSQSLATADLYLQPLLDASPVGMLVFNHREEVLLANPLAQRMLGLSPQSASLGRCGDAIRCANRLTTDKGCGHADACHHCPLFLGLRSAIAGETTSADQEGDVRLDREPGCAPLWIRYKVRPLVINGLQGAILTLDDITALRQSEQQYAMLFREMLNAFALHEIICDDRGRPFDYRFLAVNPAFERMTGLPADRVVGRTVLDIFPGITYSLIETYGRVALDGEPAHFEYFSQEIGKYFTISAFCPMPGQFACLFEDISEHKRAKEELAQSEAKYRSAYTLLRSLCDNVPDMIWAKDLKKRYLFANESLCRGLINATDTEEPLGKSDLLFAERERASHPDNPQWHTFGELCRDSDAITMDAGKPMQFDEFGNIRGQFLFLDVHKAPFLDEHGTMIGTVGSARDVTVLKAMEQELREREERLDLAIRGADLGTWDWHIPSGTIVTNQRWAELLGYTADEVEPSLAFWSMRIHPDDSGRTQAALARHLAGETDRYESEHRLRHRSGEWVWILDKGRVIERDGQGKPLRACGTHLDITRQKILIEQSRDGIVILDHQGKVLEANQRFADMLGYTPEEVQHLHVWDWDTQWTRSELLQAIEQVDASGDFFETCHRRKDNTTFPVEISSNGSLCDGDKLVFCVCRDISERKWMEEALRTTLHRTQIILSNIQPGILLVSDHNLIEFANQSFCDLFNLEETPADVIGITAAECIEKTSSIYVDPPREVTRIQEILAKNQPVKNEQIAISGKRTFLRDYIPIIIQGKQYGRLWHHYDISDRKQTEEALASRDALLKAILRNIPLDFWVRDQAQRIIMQSDQSVRFWGDLVQNPHADWQFDPQTVARWQKNNHHALAGNLVVEDCPFINSSGEHFEWHKIVAPVRDGENILGIIGINIDITERKRMEEERRRLQAQLIHAQKMEAIGTLAGGIAHDFNNILGAVIGYAEMARDDCHPGSALSQDLDRVIEAGNRAASLVRQILAFSRQQESKPIALDLGVIVKEVVKLLRPSLPSTIAISQHIKSSRTVLADPTQLHQVLMNLATNAFHAMEQTGGSLEIAVVDIDCSEADLALHPGIVPGPFVQLSVTDTGPGIPPEIRDRIFDPYFTTKEVGKGTGMGLAIVDGIVRGSGGFITCTSDPGKGTTFTITLPSCGQEASRQGEAAEPVVSGSGHILLVDDEKILAEMGQSMLERLGYKVTVCTGSINALKIFQDDPHRFDVVITDQTMPGMTGMDLARRLLQIRPGLPIILCTGYSNLVNETKAKAFGIKGFAMKPLTKKEVAAQLHAVLGKR